MGGEYKYSTFATEERYCSTLVRGQPRVNKCSGWGAQRVNKHEHFNIEERIAGINGELLFFVYTSHILLGLQTERCGGASNGSPMI